ncbi:MAG: hypothetical protein QOJ76_2507 [Acidobacteriota bacterium]|jgi:hypothetical protein|nr:hypothetical protein [Acidobacteriota bacterium]
MKDEGGKMKYKQKDANYPFRLYPSAFILTFLCLTN